MNEHRCVSQSYSGFKIHVVGGAFPLQQKQNASLRKPGLCCISLPFCSKRKDVPSPVAFSSSLSVHSTVSSSPFSTWRNPHFLQIVFSPPRGGSFHPNSSSGNSHFILMFLCHNFVQLMPLGWFSVVATAMTSDGVKQTFAQARVFLHSCSINCNGRDAGMRSTTPAQNCEATLEVPEEVRWLMQDTSLNTLFLL